jgi:hypothetical protein
MIFSLPQAKGWGNSRVVVMPGLRLGIRQSIYLSKNTPSPSGEACLLGRQVCDFAVKDKNLTY